MSLIDRTNEKIQLSIHDEYIMVDADFDSSLTPSSWVVIYGLEKTQDLYFYMTYEEAALLRDRLNLIIGDS